MPLPTPSPQSLCNKSLLFHPRVAEEAQNLLGIQDEILIPQLIQSLIQTSAEHIDVKDSYASSELGLDQHEEMPLLLKAMLSSNPSVFSGIPGKYSYKSNSLKNSMLYGLLVRAGCSTNKLNQE